MEFQEPRYLHALDPAESGWLEQLPSLEALLETSDFRLAGKADDPVIREWAMGVSAFTAPAAVPVIMPLRDDDEHVQIVLAALGQSEQQQAQAAFDLLIRVGEYCYWGSDDPARLQMHLGAVRGLAHRFGLPSVATPLGAPLPVIRAKRPSEVRFFSPDERADAWLVEIVAPGGDRYSTYVPEPYSGWDFEPDRISAEWLERTLWQDWSENLMHARRLSDSADDGSFSIVPLEPMMKLPPNLPLWVDRRLPDAGAQCDPLVTEDDFRGVLRPPLGANDAERP